MYKMKQSAHILKSFRVRDRIFLCNRILPIMYTVFVH
jgi:hypothetical protein